MNPDLRIPIENYIESLFVEPDPVLAQNLADADAAGLPAIQVSPNQGRLLYLLTKISGARRVLEIGTLGGYSTTWLARACRTTARSSASSSIERMPPWRARASIGPGWVARDHRSGTGGRDDATSDSASACSRSI